MKWKKSLCVLLAGLMMAAGLAGCGSSAKLRAEKVDFSKGWSNDNNGYEIQGAEVERLISVVPTELQYEYSKMGYYSFIHYGMNTFTGEEWGTGKEDPKQFNPTTVDTDQWVRVLKESGSKGVIFTAKHHDGFCLWPTKYTDHSIANSPYQDGKGDIVKQMADSCKKYGMKLGIYLSPWDRHEKTYATAAYDDYFVNQLTELCTNYGELFCIWFDGAKGEEVPEDFRYDFDRYYALIRKLQPNCLIANCGPDVRWIGNEAGKVRTNEWSVISKGTAAKENAENSQKNDAQGKELQGYKYDAEDIGSREIVAPYRDLQWYPGEADASIRYDGWFSHKNPFKVRSVSNLCKLYYAAVGGNAALLLNVPPNKDGVIPDREATRLKKFGEQIQKDFSKPIAYSVSMGNDQAVQQTEAMQNMAKEDSSSYAFQSGEYIMDLNFQEAKTVRRLFLREDIRKSQRVEAFDVYAKVEGGYTKIADSTVIGSGRVLNLDKKKQVATDQIRIVFRQSRSNPVMNFVGVYES